MTVLIVLALILTFSNSAHCEEKQLITADFLKKAEVLDSKIPVTNISLKEHIKSLLPSLRVASYDGSTTDFFRTMEIRGRINNILRPTATIEVVFKW